VTLPTPSRRVSRAPRSIETTSWSTRQSVCALPSAGRAPNRRLAQELARRLGVTDRVFSMDTDALLGEIVRRSSGPTASIDRDRLRASGPVKLAPEPGRQQFATPSGRLEFYSDRLARQGLPPMPDWVEEAAEAEEERRWPLRLLTAPGYYQSHTAFSAVASLRRKQGPPECVLHPDAAARQLRDGESVQLVNQRGLVTLRLRVSDETPPGVVFVPGQRPAGEAGQSTINMLVSDRFSDLGEGATYQDTQLDVRPVPA
jgi:anaerobic selenocysteine-containing dehydrogenase